MHLQIEPSDFAQLMALPHAARHDLLEFLGSTCIGPAATGDLVRTIREQDSAARRRPQALPRA
jgi:hypothetical protein